MRFKIWALAFALLQSASSQADFKSWFSSPKAALEPSLESALKAGLGQSYESQNREILVKSAAQLFKNCSRQQVERALDRLSHVDLHDDNAAYLGVVEMTGSTAKLRIRKSLLTHPFSNVVLIHEISHLTRLHLRLASKLHPLEDEALAFGAQYDYLKANYALDEAAALRAQMNVKVDTPSLLALRREGLINAEAKIVKLTTAQEERLERDSSLRHSYENYLSADYDIKLAADIQKAYRFSRDEYIRYQLGSGPAYIAMGAKPVSCEEILR